MPVKSELKVGDWVHVLVVGIKLEGNEPAYQIESIEGEEYSVVQKEGFYEHRMKVKRGKLRKL